MSWRISLYKTDTGKSAVKRFITTLPTTPRSKVARRLKHLEEFGPNLPMPFAKPLGRGLYELRVRGRLEVRLLYTPTADQEIVILHGFIKKTQTTPAQEFEIARVRQQEFTKLKN